MTNTISSDVLERAINSAVQHEMEVEIIKAINEAKQRLEARIPEIVAAVSLRVHSVFSVQKFEHEVLIHVRLDGKLV